MENNAKIIKRNIADASEEWIKIFGANKNFYRHIPLLIDGLKPVHRRFLYALYLAKAYNGREIKLSTAGGNTMGNFHPHGDTSITDAAVGMAQSFTNNIPFVTNDGNFGSINGDPPAAPRYLEIGISPFGYHCFFKDFDDTAVDMRETYTGQGFEPEFLPSRYPVALLNGAFSSIGYGLASNIPPYNFTELCTTTIELIKNPEAKITINPDLPTGADIVDNGELNKIRNGNGKLKMRSTYEIDYINNEITITSIPLQVTTHGIVQVLVDDISKGKYDMKTDTGKITLIKDIKDNTKKDKVKLQILLHPSANPDTVIDMLINSKAGLQKTNSGAITMIDEYRDVDLSVRDFLLEWISYRRDIIRSSYNGLLIKFQEENHMNDIKLYVFNKNNAERTITMAKKSANREEFINALVDAYNITTLQARTIATMPASAYTKAAYAEYIETRDTLNKRILETEEILDSDKKIDDIIIEQLKEGIEKFGYPRRSRIIPEDGIIEDSEHIVAISSDGYIKKLEHGKSTKIGHVSKNSGVLNMVIKANNQDSIMIFDSLGNMFKLPVADIPDMKVSQNGVLLSRYIPIKTGSHIVKSMVQPSGQLIKGKGYTFLFITKKGLSKRTNVEEFITSERQKLSLIAMNVDSGDELVDVLFLENDTNDIIIYTNIGDGIRVPVSEVNIYKRVTKGTRFMKLRATEEVVGVSMISPDDELLIYFTSGGKAKSTKLELLPTMSRKDDSLPLISLEGNERLVTILSGNRDDTVRIYKKISEFSDIPVSDIPITTRVAKATKIVKNPKGDHVVTVRKLD